MDDAWWLAAAARVAAEFDDGTREEAAEVFTTEAARCRLVDREGHGVVRLVWGHTISGLLAPQHAILDHLAIEGRERAVVATRAITSISGGRPALRAEAGARERTLASALRELWTCGGSVRALACDGAVLAGALEFVGADHVDLRAAGGRITLPFIAVAGWTSAAWPFD